MSSDKNISTRYKTTIDVVWYFNRFHSRVFVSYFSSQKPIISILESDDNNSEIVTYKIENNIFDVNVTNEVTSNVTN